MNKTTKAGAAAKRVLVVDEDWVLGEALGLLIEDLGHVVVGPARDRRAGLRLVAEQVVDAALLDIALRHETSFDLARELVRRGIPFAFYTGATAVQLPAGLENCAVHAKPLPDQQLRRVIEQLLAPSSA